MSLNRATVAVVTGTFLTGAAIGLPAQPANAAKEKPLFFSASCKSQPSLLDKKSRKATVTVKAVKVGGNKYRIMGATVKVKLKNGKAWIAESSHDTGDTVYRGTTLGYKIAWNKKGKKGIVPLGWCHAYVHVPA